MLGKQRVQARLIGFERVLVLIGIGERQRPEGFARGNRGARLQHLAGCGEPGVDAFSGLHQGLGRRRADGLQHRRHDGIWPILKPEIRLAVEAQDTAPLECILRFEEAWFDFQCAVEIEAADVQHLLHGCIGHFDLFDAGHEIHRPEPPFQRVECVGVNQINLVDDDDVREGDLRCGFLAVVELQLGMFRIDQGYDAVQVERLAGLVVDEERLRHRARVCQSGGLDQDPVELVAPLDQVSQDADQVASHGAADAAVVHLEDFFVGIDHQLLIDADLAKLVLDHGDALTVVLRENSVEQGGLAAAQKSGQHGYGNTLGHLANLSVT